MIILLKPFHLEKKRKVPREIVLIAVFCFFQCTALNRPVPLDSEEKNVSLQPEMPAQSLPDVPSYLPGDRTPHSKTEPDDGHEQPYESPQHEVSSPKENTDIQAAAKPEKTLSQTEDGDALSMAETVFQEIGTAKHINTTKPTKYREERFLLSKDMDDYATEVILKQGEEDGKVALLMGGAHGNEPGGYLTLLEFARRYRPKNGTLVILPLQNPMALKNETRSSMGPILNNYYNFSRAFPAKTESPERDEWIWSQFRGENDTWWWYNGDQELTDQGVISQALRFADTLEGLLDEEGFRRALDPDIKKAAESVYKLMFGQFPDGTTRYDQIDLLVDLHEAAWFYQDVLCVDDPESVAVLESFLPEINQQLRGAGLDPVSACLSPLPTSPGWAARYELPRQALAITTETNRRLPLEKRLETQMIFLEIILARMGFRLEKIDDSVGAEPAG